MSLEQTYAELRAEIERQHKQIDDAEAMIEQLTADEEQLRASAKEDAAEIERLRAALHGAIEATDLDEVGLIARRALEQK